MKHIWFSLSGVRFHCYRQHLCSAYSFDFTDKGHRRTLDSQDKRKPHCLLSQFMWRRFLHAMLQLGIVKSLTAGFIYNSLKNKHKSRSEKFLFYELLLALRDCDNRAFRSCCCWWNQRRWRLSMMPMIPSHAMYWEHKDYFIRTRVRSLFYPYY